MFGALDRLSIEDNTLHRYYKLISNVLKRCVYWKVADVPQVVVEQIQIRDEHSSILTASEIPYYTINTEFIDTLNIVIKNAHTMEQVNVEKIGELESKIQNLEFQIETLKIKLQNSEMLQSSVPRKDVEKEIFKISDQNALLNKEKYLLR